MISDPSTVENTPEEQLVLILSLFDDESDADNVKIEVLHNADEKFA